MSTEYEIPEEYTKADYGFSAIDEATYKAPQAENEVTPPSIDENDVQRAVLNAMKPIEDKLDALMSRKRAEDDDAVAAALSEAGSTVSEKLQGLESIIMPLLINLKKTADKEYIYWPNRTEAIDKEIQKVLSLTRG